MIELPNIPERPTKPREKGLTMVMDKGISTVEAEGLMETSEGFIDIIKFGFGTSGSANTKSFFRHTSR